MQDQGLRRGRGGLPQAEAGRSVGAGTGRLQCCGNDRNESRDVHRRLDDRLRPTTSSSCRRPLKKKGSPRSPSPVPRARSQRRSSRRARSSPRPQTRRVRAVTPEANSSKAINETACGTLHVGTEAACVVGATRFKLSGTNAGTAFGTHWPGSPVDRPERLGGGSPDASRKYDGSAPDFERRRAFFATWKNPPPRGRPTAR